MLIEELHYMLDEMDASEESRQAMSPQFEEIYEELIALCTITRRREAEVAPEFAYPSFAQAPGSSSATPWLSQHEPSSQYWHGFSDGNHSSQRV